MVCLTNASETTEQEERAGLDEKTPSEIAQALEKTSAVNATLVLKDGYEPADISFVDNSEVGWDCYSDDPWNTDEQSDQLAQQALHYVGTRLHIWVL